VDGGQGWLASCSAVCTIKSNDSVKKESQKKAALTRKEEPAEV
jgi:hypothetical protein